MSNPSAAMVIIGDEILSGRTRDANMHHLATELTLHGIDLKEVRVVVDDTADIAAAVNALRARFDHVFTTGGIGPTHDDITADSIAAAFEVPIDVRDDAKAVLAQNYPNGEADLTPARLRMARIPDGAHLIDNAISFAPGFSLENVHVMAGIPKVFQSMLAWLLPQLEGGQPILSETVRAEVIESQIAGPLGDIAKAYPQLSLGSYPFNEDGVHGANLVVRGHDKKMVSAAVQEIKKALDL